MSALKSEGTIVQENGKTYWFKNDFNGEEVSAPQAIAVVEGIVGRKLNTFESKLLMSRLFDGSTNITIISMLVLDPSQATGVLSLRSVRREVIGYIIRRRDNAARHNYGDIIGTDGFYDTDGNLAGELTVTRRQEPGLETPLLDPIDLAGGALADIVKVGVKKLISASFRAATAKVEQRLLARGATNALAKFRVLTEEELSVVWGGSAARPLTPNQVEKAVELLRNGTDVHVESLAQMRQIQTKLGQLGVRSESSSAIIPQRPAVSTIGKEVKAELPGSFKDGPGTYRVDGPHGPGTVPYHPHNEYPHINITLRNGKTLEVIVTGSKSF
jgi:hypothetical protein